MNVLFCALFKNNMICYLSHHEMLWSKKNCIETYVSLATMSEAGVTTTAAPAISNPNSETTESPDCNNGVFLELNK